MNEELQNKNLKEADPNSKEPAVSYVGNSGINTEQLGGGNPYFQKSLGPVADEGKVKVKYP